MAESQGHSVFTPLKIKHAVGMHLDMETDKNLQPICWNAHVAHKIFCFGIQPA